jgi:hypothetical protein
MATTHTRPPQGAEHLPPKFWHHWGNPDALHTALTTDTEEWDSQRFAAEVGRALPTFGTWVYNRDRVERGKKPAPDHRTAPPCDGPHPDTWTAGTARQWMMQNGFMRRDGRPGRRMLHKSTGRRVGVQETRPRNYERAATRRIRDLAPQLLTEYTALTQPTGPGVPLTARQAKETLAEKHGLKDWRKVEKYLTAARKMLNAPQGIAARPLHGVADQLALTVLDDYTTLTGQGMGPAQARKTIADQHGFGVRRLDRLLPRGRKLAEGIHGPAMHEAYTALIAAGVSDQEARRRVADGQDRWTPGEVNWLIDAGARIAAEGGT